MGPSQTQAPYPRDTGRCSPRRHCRRAEERVAYNLEQDFQHTFEIHIDGEVLPQDIMLCVQTTVLNFFTTPTGIQLLMNMPVPPPPPSAVAPPPDNTPTEQEDVTYIPPSSLLPISQRRVPTNFNSNSLKKPLCLLLTCLIMMNLSRWTCLVLPFALLIFTLCGGITRCFSMGGLIMWVAQPA